MNPNLMIALLVLIACAIAAPFALILSAVFEFAALERDR